MEERPGARFRLGPFEIRGDENRITGPDGESTVEPKAMAVLLALAGAEGRVVRRETLLDTVWPRGYVTDDVLTHCVVQLRRALDDDPRSPHFIATVPKVGYRLLVPAEPPEADSTRASPVRLRLAAAGLAVVAALASALILHEPEPTPAALPVVAVLPFDDLSTDGHAYFADGVHEEILAQVSRLSGLEVISRTSVLRFRDSEQSLVEISRALGADVVLEGSVRRADDRVRVTAQLIDAPRDVHLWAESYDRELEDIFAIQSDVARAVADALETTLTPDDMADIARLPTADIDAYEHYLQALNQLRRGYQEHELRQAITELEAALEHDPEFVEAWILLARTHGYVHWFGYDRSPVRLAQARDAAERVLSLAPERPEAMHAMGEIHYREGDYATAVDYLEAAWRERREVAPTLAALYRRIGRWDDSIRMWELALERDPLSAMPTHELGATYWAMGRHEEADRMLTRARALEVGEDTWGYYTHALVHLHWHQDTAAARHVLDAAPSDLQAGLSDVRLLLDAVDGKVEEGLMRLRELPLESRPRQLIYVPREAVKGEYLRFMGKDEPSREQHELAYRELSALREAGQADAWILIALAHSAAVLDHRDEAMEASRRAGEKLSLQRDTYWGPMVQLRRARVKAMLGETDDALSLLGELLEVPSPYSPDWLAIDPYLAPLQETPEFERLLAAGGRIEMLH